MAMFWQIEKLCALFKKKINICPFNTTYDATPKFLYLSVGNRH
jgi:hypothetical protein